MLTLGDLGGTRRRHRRRSAAAANWWDPNSEGLSVWAAYAAKSAVDLAVSYTDVSGNSHDAGVGVAPTWDAVNGWIFNGTTQYLTTTFVPAQDGSQTVLVQYTNVSDVNGVLFGSQDTIAGEARFYTFPNYVSTVLYGQGQYVQNAPQLLAGNLAVAGNQGYRNGIADGGAIGVHTGQSTEPLYIGARNHNGSPSVWIAAYIQALAIYDTALTAPQVLSIATAMAAL